MKYYNLDNERFYAAKDNEDLLTQIKNGSAFTAPYTNEQYMNLCAKWETENNRVLRTDTVDNFIADFIKFGTITPITKTEFNKLLKSTL